MDWERLQLVEKIVDEIVAEHHPHLARAKIVVLGKPKAGKRGGKVNVAKASKAAAALNALVKDEIGEVHYQIAIGLDGWDKLSPKQRRIVLDHELMHFAGQDEAGKWVLVGHDVEAFTAEIRRHGAWTLELEIFCREAQQLALPLSA